MGGIGGIGGMSGPYVGFHSLSRANQPIQTHHGETWEISSTIIFSNLKTFCASPD